MSNLSEYFNIKDYWEITIPREGFKTKKLYYLVEAETEEDAKSKFRQANLPIEKILSVKESKITHVLKRELDGERNEERWYKVTLHIEDFNYNDGNAIMAAALLVYMINGKDMIEPLQYLKELYNKENVYIDFLEVKSSKYEDPL